MHVTGGKIAHLLAAAGKPHFVARGSEVVSNDEVGAAAADHFLRPVAENCKRTGADPKKISAAVGNQDEVQRRFENAPALLGLAPMFAMLFFKQFRQLRV